MKKLFLVLGLLSAFAFGSVAANAEEQTVVSDSEIVTVSEEVAVLEDSAITPEGEVASQENVTENQVAPRASYQNIYRLYNPNSGAHFFTASSAERDALVRSGWRYEQVAWRAPVGAGSPVHRRYNQNSGEHLYTLNFNEATQWRYEGVAFNAGFSATNLTPRAVYRLFNPRATSASSHHYTTNVAEVNMLVNAGWRNEGAKFFVA